ncbi:MAG TPA: hypothetical protein VF614_14795 [Chthoniobacteraceae bacterium]|jgi:hypothetical protein
MFRTRLFLILLAFIAASPAYGQLSVDLQIKRRSYLRFEPLLATVAVTNLSGRDMTLRDADGQWFGFQVHTSVEDGLVPPRNPDYKLDPLEIKAGETVKRTVNLNELFSLSDVGIYRIRATIYAADLNKYFSSKNVNISLTEGRVVRQQTVGVPDGATNAGSMHTVTLLAYQGTERRYLYARVEDKESGTVFCTYQLGHMIDGTQPELQFDRGNNAYVLHLVGPKTYRLTKIGVNGEFLGQSVYTTPKSRPYIRRLADGTLQIVGGKRELAQNTADPAAAPVNLSDRPANLPRD